MRRTVLLAACCAGLVALPLAACSDSEAKVTASGAPASTAPGSTAPVPSDARQPGPWIVRGDAARPLGPGAPELDPTGPEPVAVTDADRAMGERISRLVPNAQPGELLAFQADGLPPLVVARYITENGMLRVSWRQLTEPAELLSPAGTEDEAELGTYERIAEGELVTVFGSVDERGAAQSHRVLLATPDGLLIDVYASHAGGLPSEGFSAFEDIVVDIATEVAK